jgi:HAD superfamily hydrolase (TIGR01509 family)
LDPAEQAALAERLFAHKDVAPEMRALLDELQGRTRLAIISNATDTLEAVLTDRYRVDRYFELIINSARVGYAKPKAEIFLLALERLGLRPEQTVFIDDQQHNVEAAAELGMHAVRFSSVRDLREYLAEVGVLAG